MEITDSNKKVQELVIALLNVFIEICRENNLRYYFAGGALIGVMRHKGFIPWDDDVDICMPRKDFDRLHEVLNVQMPKGYGICNRYTDDNWHFAMSQFIDLESEVEIHLAEQPRRCHIWLDVFPIDGVPTGKVARWLRVKNILLHRYLVQAAHIDTQVDAHRNRSWYERVILSFLKTVPLGKILNSNRIMDHMEKILRKTDFETAVYAGNMLGRYREREVVMQKYYGTPKKGEFESIIVDIPEMSHEFLTAIYGNYMQVPPEEQRMAHNVKILKCRSID